VLRYLPTNLFGSERLPAELCRRVEVPHGALANPALVCGKLDAERSYGGGGRSPPRLLAPVSP